MDGTEQIVTVFSDTDDADFNDVFQLYNYLQLELWGPLTSLFWNQEAKLLFFAPIDPLWK